MGSFLVPQKEFSNLIDELKKQPEYIEGNNYFQSYLQQSLSNPKNESQIQAYLEKTPKVYNQQVLTQIDSSILYEWTQENDTIIIKIPNHEQQAKFFFVDNQTIESRFINGRFFAPFISNIIKKFPNYYEVTLLLKDSTPWPILIASGNVDPYSALMLSIVGEEMKNQNIYLHYLIYSGSKNFPIALQTLSLIFLDTNPAFAFYWNVQLYIFNASRLSPQVINETFIVEMLISHKHTFLAENFLIELAKKQNGFSFLYLGLIYLDGTTENGFILNPTLAIQYFEEAALKYKNIKALQILYQGYSQGIKNSDNVFIVQQDLDKAETYNSLLLEIQNTSTIESKEETNQHFNNDLDNKTETEEKNKNKDNSISKWLVPALTTIAAISLAIFLRKKRR